MSISVYSCLTGTGYWYCTGSGYRYRNRVLVLGTGTGTGSFYGAGGEAISFGRPSFQHGNSLSGSTLNGVTGVAVAAAAARRASEGSGYQGITLGRRKSSEGVVFENPAYDQGEAPYNTTTNEVPGNAGWF